MERKQDLAKIALTALLLSATAPVQADHNVESQEVFLAALGCGANSCAATGRGRIADNTDITKSTSDYSYQPGSSYTTQPSTSGSSTSNTRTNTSYPSSTSTYGTSTTGSSETSSTPDRYNSNGYGKPQSGYGAVNHQLDTGRTYNDTYYNSYNANRTSPTSPSYVDSYRGTAEVYEASPYPYGGNYSTKTNLNRDYNTSSDYDYNRGAATTSTSSVTLTEAQLLGMLNPQARAIYLSLDPEGKALAIQLASQDSYRDKNLAIKEAQRRMNDRRGMTSR